MKKLIVAVIAVCVLGGAAFVQSGSAPVAPASLMLGQSLAAHDTSASPRAEPLSYFSSTKKMGEK